VATDGEGLRDGNDIRDRERERPDEDERQRDASPPERKQAEAISR
jgi:hypothetical protein